VKSDLGKLGERNETKKRTEATKTEENDVMEKYRKLFINDVIKNHD